MFSMALTGTAVRGSVIGVRSTFRNKATAVRARSSLVVVDRLQLTPTGDGSTDHLAESVPMPEPINLVEGTFEVGRDEPADIVLPVPTISSRHAMIKIKDGCVYVTDLRSTNGTYVEGEEIPGMLAVEVPIGGEVIFGDGYLARFELQELPDPEPIEIVEPDAVSTPEEPTPSA